VDDSEACQGQEGPMNMFEITFSFIAKLKETARVAKTKPYDENHP
jgi:hypothetical protein